MHGERAGEARLAIFRLVARLAQVGRIEETTLPRSNLALAARSMRARRCLNAWMRPCLVGGRSGSRSSSANLVTPQRTRWFPLLM